MKKGFVFSFDAVLALSVAILAILFVSTSLSQVQPEKSFLHEKIQAGVSVDQNFYFNQVPSESLSGSSSGYCSVFLKFPNDLSYPSTNLTTLKRCVTSNE